MKNFIDLKTVADLQKQKIEELRETKSKKDFSYKREQTEDVANAVFSAKYKATNDPDQCYEIIDIYDDFVKHSNENYSNSSWRVKDNYYKYFEVKFQDIHSFYICVTPDLIRVYLDKDDLFEFSSYRSICNINYGKCTHMETSVNQNVIDRMQFCFDIWQNYIKVDLQSIEDNAKKEIDILNKEIDFLKKEIESLDVVAKESNFNTFCEAIAEPYTPYGLKDNEMSRMWTGYDSSWDISFNRMTLVKINKTSLTISFEKIVKSSIDAREISSWVNETIKKDEFQNWFYKEVEKIKSNQEVTV